MRLILGWLFTPIFLVLCIVTLLVWHPLIVASRYVNLRLHWSIVALGNRLLLVHLAVVGKKLEISGLDTLPKKGPLLIISNHQSFFDISFFIWYFRRFVPKFIAKKELARGFPSASYVLRTGGSALIDRTAGQRSIPIIAECGALAERLGHAVVIFPEGTRSRDGEMKQFRPAGTMALMNAMPGATIVPVAIDGSWEMTKWKFFPVPFGGKISLTVLAPRKLPPENQRAALVHDIEAEIKKTIATQRESKTA